MEPNVNTDAMIKNVKLVELNISIATVFLKAQGWFISYNQKYHGKLNEKLKEWFLNARKYSNHDSNKFNLWLQKAVYPYRYNDIAKKLKETSLPCS